MKKFRRHELITLLFGIAVWLFFAVFYRHHLHYQEEIQLFLTTAAYFTETTAVPGGVADYASRFLTQCFIDSFAGAFCIVCLLIALQRLVGCVAGRLPGKADYFSLSFAPSLLYACALTDENLLLTALIALIMALSGVAIYPRIRPRGLRFAYLFAMIPALYWLAGCVSLLFGAMCLMEEGRTKTADKRALIGIAGGLPVVYLLPVAIAKYGLELQSPLIRLALAGHYYRYPGLFPGWLLILVLLIFFYPLLMEFLPPIARPGRRWLVRSVLWIGLAGLAAGGWNCFADWEKEEMMAYDYFARRQKWNTILRMADKKSPDAPHSVAVLNLALAQKNGLLDRLFDYFQNGPQGLLPDFRKEFILDQITGEVYYHLGMVNTAQRFAFEAMEAVPDHQKSVRSLRRLAETNLINGQYDVARKYLYLLKHTTFYRRWAEETDACLSDEEKINAHPEWGKLRRFRPREDFLFSETEKDRMLGILSRQNPDNRMACHDLLAYTLLTKDLARFADCYAMNRTEADAAIPRHGQEALAFIWSQTGFRPAMRPAGIPEPTVRALQAFLQAVRTSPDPQKTLLPSYGKTYWYYLLFK